jgi:xanthine/uracil permease
MIGIVASLSSGLEALYSSIFIGGLITSVIGFTNMLSRVRSLFTTRIVAVILILIAFTLSPVMLRLITSGEKPGILLLLAVVLVFLLIALNEVLKGALKSLTIALGLTVGSILYFLAYASGPSLEAIVHPTEKLFFIGFKFEVGTILAFLLCFFALTINEMGSVEAVGNILKADDMDNRLRRGVGVTGLGNAISGSMGVIGQVDFSMSAGLILATGSASRIAFIPAGVALIACAFLPSFVRILASIPLPVMGAVLLYTMVSQLAAGLSMLVQDKAITSYAQGITVGLPLMIGLLVAFAPIEVFEAYPSIVRPIISNGFVMGTLSVLFMEHVVYRKKN